MENLVDNIEGTYNFETNLKVGFFFELKIEDNKINSL